MGGGAHTLLESKSCSTPGVRPGRGESLCLLSRLEKKGGGWDMGEPGRKGEGDGNIRQASAGGHTYRRGRSRVSRRARTGVRWRPSYAAAPDPRRMVSSPARSSAHSAL